MSPERIDSLLTNYKPNKARLAHLRREADELRRSIQSEQLHAVETDAIRAQQYSGMPHTGAINRAMEDTALRYADGYQSPILRDWSRDLAAMEQEITSLEYAVGYVGEWLDALDDEERVVLISHTPIGPMSWRELAFASKRLLGYELSQSGLRKIGESAKRKIYDMAR